MGRFLLFPGVGLIILFTVLLVPGTNIKTNWVRLKLSGLRNEYASLYWLEGWSRVILLSRRNPGC
jgi:hypothetical protein